MEKYKIDGKLIGSTWVGSHIWKMNDENSDVDEFVIYQEPTHRILNDTANLKPKRYTNGNRDGVIYEVSHVVKQLLTGNINFILGVMSPIVKESTTEFWELRQIVKQNLSKCSYNSINGLVTKNYRKYIESEKDNTQKRRSQVLRILNFGITLLEQGELVFAPVENATEKQIENKLSRLKIAYEHSVLPEKPNEQMFRDWLLKVRLS